MIVNQRSAGSCKAEALTKRHELDEGGAFCFSQVLYDEEAWRQRDKHPAQSSRVNVFLALKFKAKGDICVYLTSRWKEPTNQ